MQGTLYQFGETPVATKVSVTKVESSGQAAPAWMRITIHEDAATAVNPEISDLFESQYSGEAPTFSRTAKKEGTKGQRWKNNRTEGKLALDAQLREAITKVHCKLFPTIQMVEQVGRITRTGSAKGARVLSAVYAVAEEHSEALLRESGFMGMTFAFSYIGNALKAEQDKEKYDIVWIPNHATMEQAFATSKTIPCALGVVKGEKKYIGIRAISNSEAAKKLYREIRGTESGQSRKKWKLEGISSDLASRGQVAKILEKFGWKGCDVVEVRFDHKTKASFAIARADPDPPSYYCQVGEATPWVIAKIDEALKKITEVAQPDVLLAEEVVAIAAQKKGAQRKGPELPQAPPTPLHNFLPSWLGKIAKTSPSSGPASLLSLGSARPTSDTSTDVHMASPGSSRASGAPLAAATATLDVDTMAKVQALEQRLADVTEQIDAHDESMRDIEIKVTQQGEQIKSIGNTVEENAKEVRGLGGKMDENKSQMDRMEELLRGFIKAGAAAHPEQPPPSKPRRE